MQRDPETRWGEGVRSPSAALDILAVLLLVLILLLFPIVVVIVAQKGHFTSENDAAKKTVRWLEVPAIAQVTGLSTMPTPPVLVEEVRPPTADGQPFTRQLDQLKDFSVTPEKHLVYAVTWFSLAVFGVILTYLRLRKKAPPARPRPRAA